MAEDGYQEEAQTIGLELLRVYEIIVTLASLFPIPIVMPSIIDSEEAGGDITVAEMVEAAERTWTIIPDQVTASEVVRIAAQTALTHWLTAMHSLGAYTHHGDGWMLASTMANLHYAEHAAAMAADHLSGLADD